MGGTSSSTTPSFPIDPDDASRYPSPNDTLEDIGCDINLSVSDNLVNWTKIGPIVPHEVSRLWCKGAVIPRNANGDAVRVGGEFLMYLSEGCNGPLHIGRSVDLVTGSSKSSNTSTSNR